MFERRGERRHDARRKKTACLPRIGGRLALLRRRRSGLRVECGLALALGCPPTKQFCRASSGAISDRTSKAGLAPLREPGVIQVAPDRSAPPGGPRRRATGRRRRCACTGQAMTADFVANYNSGRDTDACPRFTPLRQSWIESAREALSRTARHAQAARGPFSLSRIA